MKNTNRTINLNFYNAQDAPVDVILGAWRLIAIGGPKIGFAVGSVGNRGNTGRIVATDVDLHAPAHMVACWAADRAEDKRISEDPYDIFFSTHQP